jgi:hypothetical protein
MKRIVLTVASSSLLVLAAPGIAAAANHKHARHHARHASAHVRHAHAKHASVVKLGTLAAPTAPAVVTQAPPSTPTAFTGEQVAVVVSFEKEILTLELSDKSTYAGEVTEGTEIQCRPEGQSGKDEGEGNKTEEGKEHHGDNSEAEENKKLTKGEGAEEDEGCGQEALVKGAKIYGAELSLTSFGGIWEKIGVLQ